MNRDRAREILAQCSKAFEENFGSAPSDEEISLTVESNLASKRLSYLDAYLCDRKPTELQMILHTHRKEDQIDVVTEVSQKSSVIDLVQKTVNAPVLINAGAKEALTEYKAKRATKKKAKKKSKSKKK